MSNPTKKGNKKIDLGPKVASYPMPVALIGTNIGNKANFLVAAWFTSVSNNPPRIAVALNKTHFTNQKIKEQKSFSVCIPSENLIVATDYCGLVSGSKTDKSKVFDVFYGKLESAPMISECPVNLECKLEKVVDNGPHELFIGEIVSTFTEEAYLTNGVVDLTKVKPFMLSFHDQRYFGLGESKAKAWNVGKNYKP
jgi:flavin reductase (DIM6/NTAB) family NADH-FMN oxidoreductase RutF